MDYKLYFGDLCKQFSQSVNFDHVLCKNVAEKIAFQEFRYPAWREAQFPATDLKFAEFVMLTNVINFATFGPFNWGCRPHFYKIELNYSGKEYRGSEALAMAFKKGEDDKKIVLSFDFFASDKFNQKCFYSLFEDMFPKPYLMEQRFKMLKKFATQFLDKYKSVSEFMELCAWRVNGESGFIEKLSELDGYNDDKLLYNKRATLCAYMIHSRALNSNNKLLQFVDANILPPLSDPHIFNFMVTEQIIRIDDALMGFLGLGHVVREDSNSLLVNSIRAHAGLGILTLLEEINLLRRQRCESEISIIQLDNYVWQTSRQHAASGSCFYPYIMTTKC